MRGKIHLPEKMKAKHARRGERGVALITTLLLLMLLTGLTLAMAWSSRSDMLINGYYRNFRGSFYAADSGVNIMRQAIVPMFQPGGAVYPNNFVSGTNPLPSPQTEQTVMDTINAAYGSKTITGHGTGTAVDSWPGQYTGNVVLKLKSCSTDVSPSCLPFPAKAKTVNYVYTYSITSVGRSRGTENTTLTDNGVLAITAVIPTPAALTFAGYGMFIDQYSVCDGTSLVPGTITGPTFTNGSWNFGTGQYTFTDPVGQAGPTAGFGAGTAAPACKAVSGPAGNGIAPNFQQGFQMSQNKVPLPTNSFNQERAVLDGKGANPDPSVPVTKPTASEMNQVLKNVNKTPYPSTGGPPSSGVYLPYTVDGKGNATFTGGGIMIASSPTTVTNIVLAPTSSGSGQTYTITQGSTTTTITIDPGSNTTVMKSGNTTLTVNGVPHQFDPTAGTDLGYDTMLYVDGPINSLSGPGQGKPAIQDGTALTITASSNVTLTGDILYKAEPVTGTPSTPGATIDQLIPANDKGQALGIFTATGDIQLNNKQTNGNMEIDASLATISQGGTGGLTNIGSAIQTLTIVGGRIQNNIKNINTVQRNVLFDKRFANGFAPPWFPSTGIQKGNNNATLNTPVITRLQWLNQNNYF